MNKTEEHTTNDKPAIHPKSNLNLFEKINSSKIDLFSKPEDVISFLQSETKTVEDAIIDGKDLNYRDVKKI
jgi:hypothetical protein